MGSLYRSEEMNLIQLFLQAEGARSTVSQLGKLGVVQFIDLNKDISSFQRNFVNEVRRCEDIERRLRFLKVQAQRFSTSERLHAEERKALLEKLEGGQKVDNDADPDEADERTGLLGNRIKSFTKQQVEETFARITNLEEEVSQITKSEELLTRNYLELDELKHVLKETEQFLLHSPSDIFISVDEEEQTPILKEKERPRASAAPESEKLSYQRQQRGQTQEPNIDLRGDDSKKGMGFITGMVLREKMPSFERILWRSLRGNVFIKHSEVDEPFPDPSTGSSVYKCVFIVFAHGQNVLSKVRQICER